MVRIAYKPSDVAEPKDVVESIRARRGGRLLNLDRVLLHSPVFAAGWSAFLRVVRNELSVPPKLRELAICVVAALNGAEYEFHHHAPEFIKAGGSQAQLDVLGRLPPAQADWRLFDAAERAVIELTTAMTEGVSVDDTSFVLAKTALSSDQQMVELVGIIATYNMVSRFLVALDIEPEP